MKIANAAVLLILKVRDALPISCIIFSPNVFRTTGLNRAIFESAGTGAAAKGTEQRASDKMTRA